MSALRSSSVIREEVEEGPGGAEEEVEEVEEDTESSSQDKQDHEGLLPHLLAGDPRIFPLVVPPANLSGGM